MVARFMILATCLLFIGDQRCVRAKDIECHCTRDGRYGYSRNRSDPVSCSSKNKCRIPNGTDDVMCSVGQSFSPDTEESFVHLRQDKTCSQNFMDKRFIEKNVFVTWTEEREIAIFHKCGTSFCNGNFSFYPKLPAEIYDTFVHCIPLTPKRLKQRLRLRRNYASVLTCECSGEVPRGDENVLPCDENNRCSNAKFPPSKRKDVVCVKTRKWSGCQLFKDPMRVGAEKYLAVIMYSYDERVLDFIYGCRYAHMCNAGLPKPPFKVQDVVCYWTCPDLHLAEFHLKWWYFTAVSAFDAVAAIVLVFIAIFWYGLTIVLYD